MTLSNPARLRPFRPVQFGRYTLLAELAKGGMGEIFLGRMEGPNGFEKLCVIKKILPHLAAEPDFVDRFVHEAKTLVKLSHGSIAQVLDMGVIDGEPYLALEYVDGKDLRKIAGRMRDRQLPAPLTVVLFVMSRVLDALAYAHRKRDDDEREIGLVHRDISPQNILVSYEGEVKVIDFGLAKSTLSAAKTNPSIILGKFLYMSPEQARHQGVDRRSDLYAVGLCLYELIHGTNPFDEAPAGELMSSVANPRIVPLAQVEPLLPPQVSAVVMKALAVDPAQRYQTAEEFRGKLMACLLDIDPSAGPESVTRFMRDAFAAEYQAERRLLVSLREALRPPPLSPTALRAETGVLSLPPPADRSTLPRGEVTPLLLKGRAPSVRPDQGVTQAEVPLPSAGSTSITAPRSAGAVEAALGRTPLTPSTRMRAMQRGGQPETQPRLSPPGQPETQPRLSPPGQPDTQPRLSPPGQPDTQPRLSPPGQPDTQPRLSPPGQPDTQPRLSQPDLRPRPSPPDPRPRYSPPGQPDTDPRLSPPGQQGIDPRLSPPGQPDTDPRFPAPGSSGTQPRLGQPGAPGAPPRTASGSLPETQPRVAASSLSRGGLTLPFDDDLDAADYAQPPPPPPSESTQPRAEFLSDRDATQPRAGMPEPRVVIGTLLGDDDDGLAPTFRRPALGPPMLPPPASRLEGGEAGAPTIQLATPDRLSTSLATMEFPTSHAATQQLPMLPFQGDVPSRRSVWPFVVPIVLVTFTAVAYFLYDLHQSGAFLETPGAGLSRPSDPTPLQQPPGPKPQGNMTPQPSGAATQPSSKPSAQPGAGPSAVAGDDEVELEPLTTRPAKDPKPTVRQRRRPRNNPVQREWTRARSRFLTLQRSRPCELPSMSLLCARYEDLKRDVGQPVGEAEQEARLLTRVKAFKAAVDQKSPRR